MPSHPPKHAQPAVSRRRVLQATATTAAMPFVSAAMAESRADAVATPTTGQGKVQTSLRVNGRDHSLHVDPRQTLLDAVREQLGLTGAKKGCDHGQCGACTMLVDGRRRLSCLTLALSAEGAEVTTVEGLSAPGGELHPMQQAFIDHDAFQCGYCTPGQIVSAVGCITEGHAGSDAEIREYMSGNLCRCGAYANIVAAINQAKPQMREG